MTSQNGHKGMDANNSLKWGGIPKRGERSQMVGLLEMFTLQCKKFILKKSEEK